MTTLDMLVHEAAQVGYLRALSDVADAIAAFADSVEETDALAGCLAILLRINGLRANPPESYDEPV